MISTGLQYTLTVLDSGAELSFVLGLIVAAYGSPCDDEPM